MRNVMEEEATLPAQKVSVDSGSSTTLVSPCVIAVVWKLRICVVEVGDHNEPVGDAEPRDAIVFHNIGSAPSCDGQRDSVDHGENTGVGHEDCVALTLCEQDRSGVKMVGPCGIVFWSGDVVDYVHKAASESFRRIEKRRMDLRR
jgi:hypothetical protein